STRLLATDGSGGIRASGRIPLDGPGELRLAALGLDLRDIYDVMGRDTTGIRGQLAFDVEAGGTADAPTLRGAGTLADAQFGNAMMPYLEGVFNYGDRRLDANVLLWRTGDPVLRVEMQLPYDLALRGVEQRRVEGPLAVRAVGDSVELAILEAFIPTIENVRGYLDADVQIRGSWSDPELAGALDVTGGAMQLTSLGVTWDSLSGGADFAGDSVMVRDLRISSGGGTLAAAGTVTFEELSDPVLDLDLVARSFEVMAVRNLVDLTATGRFELNGPFYGATFTGTRIANEGVRYFAALINERGIGLAGPANGGRRDAT